MIYVNNHLIGASPERKINWRPLPRHYILPDDVLKYGENIIYIHLGIYGKYYGGILGNVKIQDEKNFDRDAIQS